MNIPCILFWNLVTSGRRALAALATRYRAPQQQQWASEEEREEWLNKIGNMVLVSSTSSSSRGSRSKKKSDASSWESKCIEYKKEAWPTTKQLAELDHQWDINTVKDQQKDIVSMMETVWGLKN